MARKSVLKTFIVACITSMLFVGCSNTSTVKEENKTVKVTDVKGEVEIPEKPERIVDLSGNSDTLSILGYNVIGTANSDAYDYKKLPTYLEGTLKDAKILGYSMQDTMDVEAIMNLKPDLIIISTVQEKMYEQLSEIAPTVMIKLEALDWKEDVKTLAKVFNKEEAAKTWLENYDKKAKKVGEKVKETYGKDSTYLSFLASDGKFYVFDGAGLGNILYKDMELVKPQGMPKQSDISLPVVTYEGLAEIKADYIVVIGTDQDFKTLEGNAIWNGLPAVKNGKTLKLPSSPYFNQGYSSVGRELLLDQAMEMLNGKK
ncbi:ABC transporter substrate-binding protein [Clostridium sp. SHJSY1]|uniref:ABC transporter substrate-binding protein n=1 Tax=Clostridium sp. SHJSY1 TaxID=2942483 RepID=UPI002875FDBC|nr:ABC transporter substrate-binding protein [Clostridium sp. SHJSY1]MDS0526248.1 ABC transporter substrate-binding protein [Clostridium sp. SHJSY1]